MNKAKLQDDPEVLAYQYHNPLKDKQGVVQLRDGKATIFGSAIYIGNGATELNIGFSEVNQMVADRKATCFINGSCTVWKLANTEGFGKQNRQLA